MFASLSRRRFLALSAAAAAGATFFDAARSPASRRPRRRQRCHSAAFRSACRATRCGTSRRAEVDPPPARAWACTTPSSTASISTRRPATSKIAETQKLLGWADDQARRPRRPRLHARTTRRTRSSFDFAKKAGVKVITANPEPDSFDSLDKLVAEYDIRIAIHNHGPGALFDKLDSVTKAIKGHDKRIGACVDCGHYLRSGEDPVKCVLELGDRVYGVHIKDEKETNTPKRRTTSSSARGTSTSSASSRPSAQVKFPADGSLAARIRSQPGQPDRRHEGLPGGRQRSDRQGGLTKESGVKRQETGEREALASRYPSTPAARLPRSISARMLR